MKKSLLFFFVALLCGCSSESDSTGVQVELFDTEAYLDKLYPDSSNLAHVIKTVAYDGDRQRIETEEYDLQQDLALLKEANINNPSWTDKYLVDTTRSSQSDYTVVYKSVDKKLQIKSMTTMIKDGEVVGFEAEQKRKALISDSSKRIRFEKNLGYSISTNSSSLISDQRDVHIEVRFQSE